MLRRILCILAYSFILVGTSGTTPAFAHAILLRTEPLDGAILTTSPSAVHIWFSESVQPFADGISVVGPSGQHVEQGKVAVNGAELRIAVDANASGTYTVRWRVIADDTHPTRGAFAFSVGHVSATTTETTSGEIGAVSPLGLILQTGARWLHFLGYALTFGVLAFQLFVLDALKVNESARHVWRLVNLGVMLLLAAEPLALLAQTASLGASEMLDPVAVGGALDSSFGRALGLRLGAAMFAWVLVGLAKDGTATATPIALAVGWVLALLDGTSAHAASIQPTWLGLTLNALHVAALGVWVGGLVALLVVWRAHGGVLARRFTPFAIASLVTLAATGAAMAWFHLNVPIDWFDNAYAIVLLTKVMVVALALLPATIALRRVHHHPERWWRWELIALVIAVALAGLLVSLPPPA